MMEVFVSWHGSRAKIIARKLKDWIPCVLQSVRLWMSEEDLDAGKRWPVELAKKLEQVNFGIICLTPENLNTPWILYEAGALAKTLNDSFLLPYLIRIDAGALEGSPLSQFNAASADKSGTFKLIGSINKAAPGDHRVSDDVLARTFEKWWPDLDSTLKDLPAVPSSQVSHPDPQNAALLDAVDRMGLEHLFQNRDEALATFAVYLTEEIERHKRHEEASLYIVGTSIRAFLSPTIGNVTGADILTEAVTCGCKVRILITEPSIAEARAIQEGRTRGYITGEIRNSVQQLKDIGIERQSIKYYVGAPTVFVIATTSKMLLNPYPHTRESNRCFSLIVRKTKSDSDIYHQYKKYHCETPWDKAREQTPQEWDGGADRR